METMQLPKFYNLIKVASIIGAVIGCISGASLIIGSLKSYRYSFFHGLATSSSGIIIVVSTLVSLGLILCFLSMVKAQIETRNSSLQIQKDIRQMLQSQIDNQSLTQKILNSQQKQA